MNQTNQLYTNSCKNELVGVVLTSCNKIDVINIPIGVKVYIGLDEILDTRRDYLVDNKLYLKQNDVFAEAEKLFLHTIGTANEDLKLTLTTVGTNGKYFENIKKESLQLEDKTNELLYDTKIANETLLSIIDKIVNPYYENSISLASSNVSLSTILNKTLTCDKIEFNISALPLDNSYPWFSVNVYLDNIFQFSKISKYDASTRGDSTPFAITLKNVKNKLLTIKSSHLYSNCVSSILITESTLKT